MSKLNRPFGVGIIGCGLIGQKRARALGEGRLAACADIDEARAKALAGGGAKVFSDWRDLLVMPGRGKRGSTRTLLATNRNDRWVFIFGFEKNERVDISGNELESLRKLAKYLLGLTTVQIAVALGDGTLVEVQNEA